MLAELLTPTRVSIILNIRAKRIAQLASRGELTGILVDGQLRFREADVRAFIERAPRANVPEPLSD